MKDSKSKSASECITNICISLPIAFAANMLILHFYADSIYTSNDITTQSIIYGQIAVIFTAISLVRQYLLRRLYNKWGPRATAYYMIRKTIRKII